MIPSSKLLKLRVVSGTVKVVIVVRSEDGPVDCTQTLHTYMEYFHIRHVIKKFICLFFKYAKIIYPYPNKITTFF